MENKNNKITATYQYLHDENKKLASINEELTNDLRRLIYKKEKVDHLKQRISHRETPKDVIS